MDLSLTETQELMKSTARQWVRTECPRDRLLEMDATAGGYAPELVEKAAGMGWPGMLVPEEYGGSGNSLTDAAVVFEELGHGPAPGPLFSSGVLGVLTILEAGTEEQKRSLLPQVASGRRRLCLAVTEEDYGWRPERVRMAAARRDGGFVLTGTKLFVQDAVAATDLVCAARMDGAEASGATGIALLLVNARAPGVTVRALPGFIAGAAEVTFDSVRVSGSALLGEAPGGGWDALERAMLRAIPVLCAYQVGGCQAVLDMSVEYSRNRRQFGTPIGRFQRVQDHIIEIVNCLDAARWTTYEALWKLDTGRPAAASVHVAKALASEGYLKACDAAHEVHAGVGSMREYGLTLHTRMSRTLYHFLGDPRHHKDRLGDALDL